MTEPGLRDCVILVVEDEFLLADDICCELADQNATVVGPAATVAQAMALLDTAENLTGAILDVNLRGEPVFPLADELVARNLPFVFTTGYDASAIPERFRHVTRCEKPLHMSQLVRAIGGVSSR